MYLFHRRTVRVLCSAMLLPQDVVGTNFFDKRFSVISLKKIATHHRFREIYRKIEILILITAEQSIIIRGGSRGRVPPWDDLRFSNTTGILQKKTLWFIGVEVDQETSAPPPKKNPGSAPDYSDSWSYSTVQLRYIFRPCFLSWSKL